MSGLSSAMTQTATFGQIFGRFRELVEIGEKRIADVDLRRDPRCRHAPQAHLAAFIRWKGLASQLWRLYQGTQLDSQRWATNAPFGRGEIEARREQRSQLVVARAGRAAVDGSATIAAGRISIGRWSRGSRSAAPVVTPGPVDWKMSAIPAVCGKSSTSCRNQGWPATPPMKALVTRNGAPECQRSVPICSSGSMPAKHVEPGDQFVDGPERLDVEIGIDAAERIEHEIAETVGPLDVARIAVIGGEEIRDRSSATKSRIVASVHRRDVPVRMQFAPAPRARRP